MSTNDEVTDEVILEEKEAEDVPCPHCGQIFKDLKRHLKNNPACKAAEAAVKENETPDQKEARLKKLADKLLDKAEEEEVEKLGTAKAEVEVAPEVKIKLIKDMPFEKIKGMNEERKKKLVKSLEAKDIVTPYQLSNIDVAKLKVKIEGVGEETWNKIISLACEIAGLSYLKPVSEIRNTSMVLKTGVPAIDNLLSIDEEEEGGFETGEGYLIYAKNAMGKTQICVKLLARLQLPIEKGGLYIEGKPRPDGVWMDTEEVGKGMIKPSKTGKSRLRQVARNSFLQAYPELDPAKNPEDEKKVQEYVTNVEEHTLYCNAPNVRRQLQVTHTLLKDIANRNIRLIVVDSLIENFRAEYPGISMLARRQQALNTHLHELRFLKENDAILVCTDQVVSNPDTMYGDGLDPAGGNVVRHGINIIIKITPGEKGAKIATIMDAGHLAGDSATFVINENGIDSLGGITKRDKKGKPKKKSSALKEEKDEEKADDKEDDDDDK